MDGDTGATRSHLRGKVSRRGPGPLMHESMHGAQNVHWHAPATLAREPSFAAQMSNANDPNETVLTLVRLSTSPRAPCPSLPLLPDAQPHSSLSNAEPSISRRHHALIGSSYFRSHFSSIVDDFYYVIEHDSPFQYPIGII